VGRGASPAGALGDWPEYVRELAGKWSDLPSPSNCLSRGAGAQTGRGFEVFVLDTSGPLDSLVAAYLGSAITLKSHLR